MLTAETLPAEGARYAAGLVCIPGLWAGSRVWRGFASYLGHRGWECHLLDVRGVVGGLTARAAAVREYAAALPAPAVFVGHDAGGLVALAAAARGPAAEALARSLGAELRVLEGARHWVLAGAGWQPAVALVHRWLVQRLGEPLLETYAEALADREPSDDE